jgi:hypothetical protein
VIKLAFRANRRPENRPEGDRRPERTDSRARRMRRWADAYTLAAFNPVHPYRRPIDRI